jgi:hypothetical protein
MPQHKEWPEHKGGFGSIGARLYQDDSMQKLQEMRKQLPKARKTKQPKLEDTHQEIIGGLIDLWKLCEQNYNALPRELQVLTRDLKAKIAKAT